MTGPLRIVKGHPDDDELAAIVTALAIVSARRNISADAEPSSRWRSSLRHGPLPKGPAAWRGRLGR